MLMRFKIPKIRVGNGYVPTNSVTSPTCSSSDGTLAEMGNRPYVFNVRRLADSNSSVRRALWTGKHLQLTASALPPSGEPVWECHPSLDRLIAVTSGYGEIEMEGERGRVRYSLGDGYAAIVPSGTRHVLRNTGNRPLRFYSVYTHPAHPYGDDVK